MAAMSTSSHAEVEFELGGYNISQYWHTSVTFMDKENNGFLDALSLKGDFRQGSAIYITPESVSS